MITPMRPGRWFVLPFASTKLELDSVALSCVCTLLSIVPSRVFPVCSWGDTRPYCLPVNCSVPNQASADLLFSEYVLPQRR